MRWLLGHRVCWNFVQWICFTDSRVICMSLCLWSLPCNITGFWLLGYLSRLGNMRYHYGLRRIWRLQLWLFTCRALSVSLTDMLLASTTMQQQRNPHLVQIKMCPVHGTKPGTWKPGPSTAVIHTYLQKHPVRICPTMWCRATNWP